MTEHPQPALWAWRMDRALVHCVQLRGVASETVVLGDLLPRLVEVAQRWQCTIQVFIDLDGRYPALDQPAVIGMTGAALGAELTATWRRHHPHSVARTTARFADMGWRGKWRPPLDDRGDEPWDVLTLRLDSVTDPTIRRFVQRFVHGVKIMTGVSHGNWNLIALATPFDRSPLLRHHSPDPLGEQRWHVALDELIPRERWRPVVWPHGSHMAGLACLVGLHHLHQGPCDE